MATAQQWPMKERESQKMGEVAKVEYPNEVTVAFLNPISERYHVRACENDPAAGNGRHRYAVGATLAEGGRDDWSMLVNFQKGPLPQTGHNGILSNVLLAVLIDHLKSLQEGPFRNRQTAIAITHLEEAENALARRADERKTQGILGQHKKEAA